MLTDTLTLVDVGPLLDPAASDAAVAAVAAQIDVACRAIGFVRLTGHGIDPAVRARLDLASQEFFALPDADKAEVEMSRGGTAWRGWFPVGGELTSGRPDRKEGLYVGVDHPPDHERVLAATPLHGRNLFPPGPLGPAVDEWMAAIRPVADALMGAIAVGLGLDRDWFVRHLTADPTVLFRIFHYPAAHTGTGDFGVGEHTDYGLLTLLAQDDRGGLEVRTPDGAWIEVPPDPDVLVGNIGDMLDRLTEGRYRSTPHRVRNTSGRSRFAYPYFFDPSWDAVVPTLPLDGTPPADDADRRWDGASVRAWEGMYGDYLCAKVGRVFPALGSELRL